MPISQRCAVAAMLCLPAAAVAATTDDSIVWPTDGSYLAYPVEKSERPLHFYVFGGAYHDSNVFRLPDGANTQAILGTSERSDTVRHAGVGMKADVTASRQQLLIDARATRYSYDRFGFLDNTGYHAAATWKWLAGPAWTGDVGYASDRFLAQFGELQAPIKDLISVNHAFAVAKRRITPEWQLRGGVDWVTYHHSAATLASAENQTTSFTIGADHFTPQGNSVGAQLKASDGQYPNREVVAGSEVDNQYRELEASAVANWQVSGKSRFNGRLGYTTRRHNQISQRNYHGVTGIMDYAWTPSPKTLLDLSAWRELRSIEDTLANYVLSEGVSVGPHWAPTVRTVVQFRVFRERRNFLGDPGFVLTSAPERIDTLHGGKLSFGYAPRRFVRVSVGWEHGTRDSNTAGRDYHYNIVSANARFRF